MVNKMCDGCEEVKLLRQKLAAIGEAQPDKYCLTLANGDCVSHDPRCMHNAQPASAETEPQDLQIDTSVTRMGSGGWSHFVDIGVRITHKPTGIVVEESSDRSQHRNRAIAIEKLKTMLAAAPTHAQQPRKESEWEGHLIVTKNPQGQIVAVTRQDDDGRVMSVIAESAKRQESEIAWLRVIDEAMVCSHLGVANPSDTYEEAKKKLNLLICHEAGVNEYFNSQVATEALEEAAELAIGVTAYTQFQTVEHYKIAKTIETAILAHAAQKREAGK